MSDRAYTDAELDWRGSSLKFGDVVWLKDGKERYVVLSVLDGTTLSLWGESWTHSYGPLRVFIMDVLLTPPKRRVKKTEEGWTSINGGWFAAKVDVRHPKVDYIPATLTYEVEE